MLAVSVLILCHCEGLFLEVFTRLYFNVLYFRTCNSTVRLGSGSTILAEFSICVQSPDRGSNAWILGEPLKVWMRN